MFKKTLMFLGMLLLLSWPALAAPPAKVHVLVYHSFLGKPSLNRDLNLAELARQLDELKSKGYAFVSYADLQAGRVSGAKNILISIDDGNQSVWTAYQQVFKPRGIRPLLGIYPAIIGKKSYALSWDQLKALSRAGCGIASHGYYHGKLDEAFYRKHPKEFAAEVRLSKQTLERELGLQVTAFVCPYGVMSAPLSQQLKQAGYETAFVLNWGAVLVPLSQNPDQYRLGRYMYSDRNWAMLLGAIGRSAR